MRRYKFLVVGTQLVGSAVLYQLSKRTDMILGIDQGFPPHDLGSSHSDSKIFREAIGEGHFFSPFAIRSREILRKLELGTGRSLLVRVGGIIIARPVKSELHGNSDFLGETVQAADKYQVAHNIYNAKEAAKLFPQFNFFWR